jgi:hypothetical protein
MPHCYAGCQERGGGSEMNRRGFFGALAGLFGASQAEAFADSGDDSLVRRWYGGEPTMINDTVRAMMRQIADEHSRLLRG